MENIAKAKSVLQKNWRNGYTVPCSSLYPFQWNWDAGFHAIGWMYVDHKKAIEEVRSIFKGQWKNGMLPHVVFHEMNDQYFPGPSVWKIDKSSASPEGVNTTGITQLPVFGFVLERMLQIAKDQNINIDDFVKELFPKILNVHRYLYQKRDPHSEGLPCLFHNWESTDNAPIWDAVWERMDLSEARDVAAFRKDNKKVDASMRPTDLDYKRYVHLIDLLNKNDFNEDAILKSYPFLIQENMFLSFLIRSNESLIKIGEKYNLDITELVHWQTLSKSSFSTKFWDNDSKMFYPFDLNTSELIKKDIIGGMMALFAGIPTKDQAKSMVEKLEHKFVKNKDWFLCPSYSSEAIDFDEKRYWRGPLWPNVNWLMYHGLKRYGFNQLADRIKEQTIYLIEKYGMYEYFNPLPEDQNTKLENNKGLGGEDFSWTAAIYLDFKYNYNLL